MKILVIGSGGREHALVWKLAQSQGNHTILAAPGNAGIARHARCLPVAADDLKQLTQIAMDEHVDLVVVGPEAPLTMGIADQLQQLNIPVFGPVQNAAQLEGSKVFAKKFCTKYQIPTAAYDVCETKDEAIAAAQSRNFKCVLKADGLAAGKGVFVCKINNDVQEAVQALWTENRFGDAASQVVVEDCLIGEEASILALVDGENFVILESSQDHKAAFEGDTGPNTGGMGAYSPAPVVTTELKQHIASNIIEPVVKGMLNEGTPFTGVLYAGIMVVNGRPWVLEFNVRFGDPETQPILKRLQSELAPLLLACAEGCLHKQPALQWNTDPAVCVVLASRGYPGSYEKGFPIHGLDAFTGTDETTVFHAGTKLDSLNQTVTSGGRVLGVTSTGKTIKDAVKTVYASVNKISFDNMYYRKDIAHRALKR